MKIENILVHSFVENEYLDFISAYDSSDMCYNVPTLSFQVSRDTPAN